MHRWQASILYWLPDKMCSYVKAMMNNNNKGKQNGRYVYTWIVRIKVNQKFVPEFRLNNLFERTERE